MINLIFMCGISGSGKSTIALRKSAEEKNSIVISRDNIRFDILTEKFGKKSDYSAEYFKCEREVFTKYIAEIVKAYNSGLYNNIYLDATHLNDKSRFKVINALDKALPAGWKDNTNFIFYLLICDMKTIKQRQAIRPEIFRVKDEVIAQMEKDYKEVSNDFLIKNNIKNYKIIWGDKNVKINC